MIPIPNDEHKQKQGSKAKLSQVFRTSELSPGFSKVYAGKEDL